MNPVVARARDEFIAKLLESMEAGEKPMWGKPWDAASEVPFNPVSRLNDKRASYHGGNLMRLLVFQMIAGYGDPRWVTYKQAQSMRAGSMERLTPEEIAWNAALPSDDARRVPTWQVRKGEKGSQIEFWSPGKPSSKDVSEENPEGLSTRTRWFGRVYTVFNGDQVDNMPPLVTPRMVVEPATVENLVSERVRRALGVKLSPQPANQAYYTPAYDEITMPAIGAFHSIEAYDDTLLHEVFHATGHPSRLAREDHGPFGSPGYAKEELATQLAVFFFAVENRLSLTGVEAESHNYLLSWVKMFKEEGAQVLFQAAARADRAVRYVAELLPELVERLERDEPQVAEPSLAPSVAPAAPVVPGVTLPPTPSADVLQAVLDDLPDEVPVGRERTRAATRAEAPPPAAPGWSVVPPPITVDPRLLPKQSSSLKRVL